MCFPLRHNAFCAYLVFLDYVMIMSLADSYFIMMNHFIMMKHFNRFQKLSIRKCLDLVQPHDLTSPEGQQSVFENVTCVSSFVHQVELGDDTDCAGSYNGQNIHRIVNTFSSQHVKFLMQLFLY